MRTQLVRLTLLFVALQLLVGLGGLLGVPSLSAQRLGTGVLVALAVVDLLLLALFARWALRESATADTARLAADVQRIAQGDYRHRVEDLQRPELREIRVSVNQLADRMIADRERLADNIESLEETNRELVALRDQMVHSARLASVGTLAAGIAHEVGNPLGAITGFVDVARSRAARAGADTEILDSIRSEAKRIDRIVRGLLDYARAPRDDAEAAPAAEVLAGVRELLQNQGKLDGVHLEWEVPADAPDLVTEPHRLQHVLVNLMLNALDAVQDVSEPRVRVRLDSEEGELRRLRRRREDDPPGVNYMHRRRLAGDEVGMVQVSRAARVTVIEVGDNGPGISQGDVERIFDPFYTTKEPGKGTGLGLSICAQLVEGMGGTIEASTDRDDGARFLIRLPGFERPDPDTVVASDDALEA